MRATGDCSGSQESSWQVHQPGVIGKEPEQGMGVKQERHSMYSRNSSSGSSKSSDIQILPLRLPALG